MAIIGGLDVHRRQITFNYLDDRSGEVSTGVIRPATRAQLRDWLRRFEGLRASFALEATTGWRFVVEELRAAGIEAHLAEPAETRALRGPKRRAKTDRADALHLRQLLVDARLPESWIPPEDVCELRTLVRLRYSAMAQRRCWQQRIHAQLFHHGHPQVVGLLNAAGREQLERAELPAAARQAVDTAMRLIDVLTLEIDAMTAQLEYLARREPACTALMTHYGVGALVAAAVWAEMGDTRRFSSSRKAVRHAGLDITVSESDGKRRGGRLSRQGSPVLRWALYEAAKSAYRPASPDHAYYLSVKERLGGRRATLAVARKLARRAHHTLSNLDPEQLSAAA